MLVTSNLADTLRKRDDWNGYSLHPLRSPKCDRVRLIGWLLVTREVTDTYVDTENIWR